MKVRRYQEIEYLTFELLEKTQAVTHMISTRAGGVSRGIFSSMNYSYNRGDDKACVDENFRRTAEIFGKTAEAFVCSEQTHTVNIRKVTGKDRGKGVIFPKDYTDIDGLVTDEPGIILSTFYADCVPLLFVDPIRRAIGCSHSGWRGTAGEMGRVTVERMQKEYGCRPENIYAAIGPSICQDCYEVSLDVAEVFETLFAQARFSGFVGEGKRISPSGICYQKENGKYQLNLWKANEAILLGAGILPEHLAVTDVCTCCNPQMLFSHRASLGKRGNIGAFLMLREI